jgi:hypothetical protein
MVALASLFAVPCGAPIARAQNPPSSAPPAANAVAPVVAQRANDLLKEMSTYIGSADQFTFHADITFDHVLPSGQKLQYAAAEDVALQRPNRLYVEWTGDLGDRRFWYDGSSVTLYDPAMPFYASDAAPADIDGMLAGLVPKLDFAPPLADFLYKDPYASVRRNVQFGLYLGLNDVNGRSCHTLAFVEQNIDWQIWIDTGPQLTPCKLVITYKTTPAQPRFSAVFTDWNFTPRIATPVFTPTLPPGAERIPFEKVTAAK